MFRSRAMAVLFLIPAVAAVGVSRAPAECEDLCDCIGGLGGYTTLAGSAKFAPGSYSDFGERTVIGTSVEGSACLEKGSFRGRIDGDGELYDDLILRSGVGTTAAAFAGYKDFGDPTPGFSVGGDIVTAGGTIRGKDGIDYDLAGSLLVDPGSPRVAACQQAALDASTVSAQFAARPANESREGILVRDVTTLQAGPGVWTINIEKNVLLKRDAFFGTTLMIATDAATDLVIVNIAGNLTVGGDATITSDRPEAVLLNVTGPRSKVKIGKFATVDVPILAPNGVIVAQAESYVANLWTTAKMILVGASVSDTLACEVPDEPSKAVFASSEEYDGETVASLANADALCQELAADALLSGSFKAWLSDSSTAATSRLSRAIVPYVLPDGTVVANDWTDLTDGSLAHAIDQDESEADLEPAFDNMSVWTATEADGSAIAGSNCANWTSAEDTEDGATGDAGATGAAWSASGTATCDELARLYCVEQ